MGWPGFGVKNEEVPFYAATASSYADAVVMSLVKYLIQPYPYPVYGPLARKG
jgi:hypothetical protein